MGLAWVEGCVRIVCTCDLAIPVCVHGLEVSRAWHRRRRPAQPQMITSGCHLLLGKGSGRLDNSEQVDMRGLLTRLCLTRSRWSRDSRCRR